MSEVTNDLLNGLLDELNCNDSVSDRDQAKAPRRRARDRRDSEGESRLIALARTIEGQIVPRLIMARGSPAMDEASASGQRSREEGGHIHPGDVEELVRLLLGHDSTVASAYVATIEHRGVRLETICLHLLGPAARRLGDLWSEDRADLMQVTLALCRLQTLLRELSLSTRNTTQYREHRHSILLVPAPGEQHTFGLQLIAEFFRRASWDVWLEFPSTTDELLDIVSHQDGAPRVPQQVRWRHGWRQSRVRPPRGGEPRRRRCRRRRRSSGAGDCGASRQSADHLALTRSHGSKRPAFLIAHEK